MNNKLPQIATNTHTHTHAHQENGLNTASVLHADDRQVSESSKKGFKGKGENRKTQIASHNFNDSLAQGGKTIERGWQERCAIGLFDVAGKLRQEIRMPQAGSIVHSVCLFVFFKILGCTAK